MRLIIKHNTHYHYDKAPKHLIQLLRLTPRMDVHQRVVEWRIATAGKQTAFKDAFGNLSHTHVLNTPQSDLNLLVEGVVDSMPLANGVLGAEDSSQSLPTIAYMVPTDLTAGFLAIETLAKNTLPQGLKTGQDVLTLAAAICLKIEYATGNTDVTSTAKHAFDLASGVCQDHAHVMIAACRSLGVSARYVSGYVDPGNSHEAASHAWVDVWLGDHWVSVDVTNSIFASDSHCRLAIGRDYLDACPIRGMREGGLTEKLDVSVTVQTLMQ
jgi:transglutaminase-like putative cysteine protease